MAECSRRRCMPREHSAIDPTQRHRLLSGGLDEVWVQRHAVQRRAEEEVAA